jgi:hypothetical protein
MYLDLGWPYTAQVKSARPWWLKLQERLDKEAREMTQEKRLRVYVIHKPCKGRLLINCAYGPGCPGHSVRVLVG